MMHNEDHGQDNSYLFGASELRKYWTGIPYSGHRAAPYRLVAPDESLADIVYSGGRVAGYGSGYPDHEDADGDGATDPYYGGDGELRGYTPFGSGLPQWDVLQPEVAAYETYGSGLPDETGMSRHVSAYSMRGLSAPTWCGSAEFAAAQAALCHLSSDWCAGGINGSCDTIANHIETDCTLFTGGMSGGNNSGFSDGQIRVKCQCNPAANPPWIGGCQSNLPCTSTATCSTQGQVPGSLGCCAGLVPTNGTCQPPVIPTCGGHGQPPGSLGCCVGLTALNGICQDPAVACSPGNCFAPNTCVNNICSAPLAGGSDSTTLLIVGGVAAVGLLAAIILSQPAPAP